MEDLIRKFVTIRLLQNDQVDVPEYFSQTRGESLLYIYYFNWREVSGNLNLYRKKTISRVKNKIAIFIRWKILQL